MSGNPKEFRRNALTCMQLAQASPSTDVREHFAELSQTWLRLAGELEYGQALSGLLDDFEPERRVG